MDNLTHALSGIILSRAGLNRLTPQAGWLLVLSSNLPDADIITGLWDQIAYLDLHRGPTHSLFWAPLLAAVPLPLWRWLARKARPGRRAWLGAYCASLIAVLVHLAFDWFNAYGTRLLLPFRDQWYGVDWLPIVDVWIWALLGAGVAGALLSRLLTSEMGGRKPSGLIGAWVVLALLTGWVAFRGELHGRAVATLESRLYGGEAPRSVRALPSFTNPFLWRGLVETPGAWRSVEVNLLDEFNPDAARIHHQPVQHDALAAARATPAGRAFVRFAQVPIWQVIPDDDPEGALLVTATDLRFGEPEDHRFRLEVKLDPQSRILHQTFDLGR